MITTQNQLSSQPIPPSSSPKLWLIIFVIAVILVLGGLYYFKVFPARLSKVTAPIPSASLISQTLSPQSSASATSSASLESCQVQKNGNPLVDIVSKLPDGTIIGAFRGNINNISLTSDLASIEVVSPKADQVHTFLVHPEKGLVYDATAKKELMLSDLRKGDSVVLSFNCFPNKQNLFKITQIAVTFKR